MKISQTEANLIPTTTLELRLVQKKHECSKKPLARSAGQVPLFEASSQMGAAVSVWRWQASDVTSEDQKVPLCLVRQRVANFIILVVQGKCWQSLSVDGMYKRHITFKLFDSFFSKA